MEFCSSEPFPVVELDRTSRTALLTFSTWGNQRTLWSTTDLICHPQPRSMLEDTNSSPDWHSANSEPSEIKSGAAGKQNVSRINQIFFKNYFTSSTTVQIILLSLLYRCWTEVGGGSSWASPPSHVPRLAPHNFTCLNFILKVGPKWLKKKDDFRLTWISLMKLTL